MEAPLEEILELALHLQMIPYVMNRLAPEIWKQLLKKILIL